MNRLFILSGPSGIGKTTLESLIKQRVHSLYFPVTCTTRAPREGEIDGKDYFFLSEDEFKNRMNSGMFLEYSYHYGNYYGSPKNVIKDKLRTQPVFLILDVNGAESAIKTDLNPVTIFLKAKSKKDLEERLKKRNEPEEIIKQRLDRVDYEMNCKDDFLYLVDNDNGKLEDAYEAVLEILNHYGIYED